MSFPLPPPILTERLRLRLIEDTDLPALYGFYSDPAYVRYLPNPLWADASDGERWYKPVQARTAEGSLMHFVVEQRATAQVIGICLLFNFDVASQRADVGYALGPAHWGQRYAPEILQALLSLAFDTFGLRRVDATVDPRNLASAKTLLRCGFTHEGRQRERSIIKGEAVDSSLYGLLRREWLAHGVAAGAEHGSTSE